MDTLVHSSATISNDSIVPFLVFFVFAVLIVLFVIKNKRQIFKGYKTNYGVLFGVFVAWAVPIIILLKNTFPNQFHSIAPEQPSTLLLSYILIIQSVLIGFMMKMAGSSEPEVLPYRRMKWTDEEVFSIVASAKRKIIFIQTWYPDAALLAGRIVEKCKTEDKKLNINIYELLPSSQHALERYALLYGVDLTNQEEYAKAIKMVEGHVEVSKDDFELRFNKIKEHISEINYYYYDLKPTIKAYVIDDKKYLVGWFSELEPSTGTDCFLLESKTEDPLLVEIINQVKEKLQLIKKNSSKYK